MEKSASSINYSFFSAHCGSGWMFDVIWLMTCFQTHANTRCSPNTPSGWLETFILSSFTDVVLRQIPATDDWRHMSRNDEKWQLYLLLLEMIDIIFAKVITVEKGAYLSNLIADHHSRFVLLYPNCSVIPKMH